MYSIFNWIIYSRFCYFFFFNIFYFILNRVNSNWSSENLVLGGGCAYNGTANGKIKQHTSIKNVWIPFAPSDAGSAIGACLYNYHTLLGHPKVKGGDNQSPYLGPEWKNSELLEIILNCRDNNSITFYENSKTLLKDVCDDILLS